ncbi:MAG TPA: T9SS type A sorting domain-containing protein, partial [Chitinophagaceae bacterium]|nr:T9SS type A sorting domain-containing protein [Chitinophagaceae bacterium]
YRATGTFAGNDGYNSGSGFVNFTIAKFTPVISASDLTVQYNGSPKPITGSITSANNEPLTISYTYSGIAPTVYNSSTAPSNKGTYSVALNYAGSGNYNIAATKTVTLTITGIPLTVMANNVITNNGDAPVFSYTSDPSVTLTVSYKVYAMTTTGSPTGLPLNQNNLDPGTYVIVPLVTSGGNNYTITYENGLLHVNPFGNQVKSVKPTLECVTDNGDGTYWANYAYSNTNSVDVWIPAGEPDNYFQESNPGAVLDGALPPSIFKAGGGRFKVKFDGSKTVTWILASFEKRQKTSSASSASSSSNKCGNNFVPVEGRVNFFTSNEMLTPDKVYPNPFVSRVIIETDLTGVTEKDVKVFDVSGREYKARSVRMISTRKAELDLSHLINGQYYIRVNTKAGQKVFRILRN